MPKSIIYEIHSVKEFEQILQNNRGKIVIKFGAEWCGPCKAIEHQVTQFFSHLPDNIQPYIIDVDECFELYAFLKSKKMINGIPALLCYNAGNVTPFPDEITIGANADNLRHFFNKVLQPL